MIGGELHGKFIILSFRDDEEALYNKVISAIYAISNFPIMAASADAPLLFGSLQIDPQRSWCAVRPGGGPYADGV